ncbi:oligosaccharide flippase family protein [Mucilaginibacter aquaedulcis]|uniref:oligosaccharide flippase family protein n=1 Tax=Mucilaginibacter aquaedulcis TaxID=1187081 RepID=UPI0025B35C6D|nr:oligosaccharide flippase family protein [Mucilaginibacter aquaedulcis]MDN3549757.1 oligosaccharide flippase family protein [Mucilaginibacter aquaedulcis]
MKYKKVINVIVSGFGAAGATFLLQVFLSHKLSIDQFGIYSAATSILTILGPFASVGISGLFLREACVHIDKETKYWSIALKCLGITVLLSFIVSQFLFAKYNLNLIESLALASYYFPLSLQYLGVALAQSRNDFLKVSLTQVLLPSLRLILVLVSFFYPADLKTILLLLVLSHAISFVFLFASINKVLSFGYIRVKQDFSEVLKFFKQSCYYSLNGSINVAQIQLSTIVAIFYFGTIGAGLYSSATTLLTACYILPNMIFGTYFLPKYHKLSNDPSSKTLLIKHSFVAFLSGIVFAIAVVICTKYLIGIIYPKAFMKSSDILNILSFSLPFRFFSTALGASLLSAHSIRQKVFASFTAIALQVLFIVVIPKNGIVSLAYSFLFSEIMTSVFYYFIFMGHIRKLSLKTTVSI